VLGDRHAPALIRIVRRARSWPGRRGGRSFLGREEALRRRGSFTFRSRRQTFGREPKARREELVAGFIVPLLDGSMPLQMDVARSAKDAATEVSLLKDPSRTVWFEGHWGWLGKVPPERYRIFEVIARIVPPEHAVK
jgi:hypothetical protein